MRDFSPARLCFRIDPKATVNTLTTVRHLFRVLLACHAQKCMEMPTCRIASCRKYSGLMERTCLRSQQAIHCCEAGKPVAMAFHVLSTGKQSNHVAIKLLKCQVMQQTDRPFIKALATTPKQLDARSIYPSEIRVPEIDCSVCVACWLALHSWHA